MGTHQSGVDWQSNWSTT